MINKLRIEAELAYDEDRWVHVNAGLILALLDRLEAAEKDAARYRYLRESNHVTKKGVGSSVKSGWFVNLSYESLDATIDAAMGEQK